MISCLKKKITSRYVYVRGRWKSKQVRVFTDKAISEALNIPLEEVKNSPKRKPTRWTKSLIEEAIGKFVKKNDRWPRLFDCRLPENELPYPESLGRVYRDSQWLGGEGLRMAVSEYAKDNWKTLSAELVLTIPNITERREVMNRVGIKKLIMKAERVRQDDFGTLWKFPYADGRDDSMLYVEVVNSSPQLDKNGKVIMKGGEPVYDHYFLRVPPEMKTAREGIAWTFGVAPTKFEGFVAQS